MGRRSVSLGLAGRWLIAAGASFVVVGIAVGLPLLTALGIATSVGLVWGLGHAQSVIREIRDGALVVTMEGAEDGLRMTLGRPVSLSVRLHGGPLPSLHGVRLEPGCVAPLEGTITSEDEGMTLRLVGHRIGYGWVQGVRLTAGVAGGLLTIDAWLRARVVVTVLPEHFPLRRDAPLRATRPSLQERASLGRSRRRGYGLDLRELRDHQPGDPFKHIAWAATARRGRLVTREFESDTMVSAWLLVDVSPSMFWGPPGSARIDFALETAYSLADLLLARGDRAGILLHDHRVRLSVSPSRGRGHRGRLLEAILEAPHLVHEDRTELTGSELVDAVGQWLLAQEGRAFRLPTGLISPGTLRTPGLDERRLLDAVEEHLSSLKAERRSNRFMLPTGDYAREASQSSLRAFCRHVGVPLPLDPTPQPGGQARGIEEAVQLVVKGRGGPHTLVLISDLHTVEDLEALRRAAIGARRYHHAMVLLCPSDPGFASEQSEASGPLAEALREVDALRARHALATVEAVLRPAGVTVVSCSPRDVMPRLLQRLDHVA